MGLISNLLLCPALAGPKIVRWLAQTLSEEAERELLDEGSVRGELLELQQRHEAGEIGEQEYDRQEGALLERLNVIRMLKASQAGGRGAAA